MPSSTAKKVRCGLAALLGVVLQINAAAAGPFSSLVVFGDSLSDVGNIAAATAGIPFVSPTPGPYYYQGRFSNGSVYAESLATGLGLPALTRSTAGGNDFAYGGAQTAGTGGLEGIVIRDIDEQVSQFLANRTANATTLYLVFAGGNDLINGQTNVSVPVNSLNTSVNRLITAGARNFLVINLPPLGNTPRYNGSAATRDTYNTRSQQYNSALATMVGGLHAANPAVMTYQFDLNSLLSDVLAEPAGFNLVNVTNSAAPGLSPGASSYNTNQIVSNPNQYLFWDDLHPTTAVHAVFAQRVLDLFRLPGDFNSDNTVDAADYVMWREGLSPSHIPDDYNVWRQHAGQTFEDVGTAALVGDNRLAAVPEPSATFIFLWLLGGLFGMRRVACANAA